MNTIISVCIALFFIFILLKERATLIKEKKQERECYIKTLNHDFRVATLAQIRALDLLYKTCNIEQKDLVQDISDSCKYSLDMITCLMNTYKFDNGEQILKYNVFNLTDLIQGAISNISEIYRLKNFKIDFDSLKDNFIEADKEMISKLIKIILITCVLNSETSEIKIIVKKELNRYLISLSYVGKALSEEEYRRMFMNEPCYTTVGQGIRMYFCKKIVEFHGGSINVFCNKKTNEFTFDLLSKRNLKPIKMQAFDLNSQIVF